jgi:hypothetical protein
MKMKLPEAPPELLQDTVPPNGSVKPPPAEATPEDAVTTDAPVVEGSRSNDTLIIPRVQRQKRLRSVVIGVVCVGVALLAIGFVVARGGQAGDPAESEQGDVQVLPVNAAAEGERSVPVPAAGPVAAPPKDEPAPAAAAPVKSADKQLTRAPAETGRKPTAADVRPGAASPPAAPEAPKPATQSPKPSPASSARGKQPWIDGL